MTSVVVLLLSIAVSFVVVRVGAVALELTGIRWSQAKFQALSAFTNSGFTTRESEQITQHPMRRRIASILIILGNAGLVAVMGSFASSLVTTQPMRPLINLGAIVGGVSLIVWVGRGRWFGRRLRRGAKEWLNRHYRLSEWSPDDLLHLDEGFALTRFVIDDNSPAVGRRLVDLRLKDHAVQILAIERNGVFHPIPRGDDHVRAGDQLVVFGRATAIEHLFEPEDASSLELVQADETTETNAAAAKAGD